MRYVVKMTDGREYRTDFEAGPPILAAGEVVASTIEVARHGSGRDPFYAALFEAQIVSIIDTDCG